MLSSTRKGQAAQNIVVTLVIAAMLVTGIGIFFASMATNYPSIAVSSNPEYNSVMLNATAIYGQGQGLQNESEALRENTNVLTGLSNWGGLVNKAFGLVNFVQSFFTAIGKMTGLPIEWVVSFIVLLGIVMVAFSVANWMRGSMRGL